MQPLVFAPAGRALAAFPALGAGNALDVRRVEQLPDAESLDPERPTVVLLDRGLAERSGGPGMLGSLAPYVAFVGIGDVVSEHVPFLVTSSMFWQLVPCKQLSSLWQPSKHKMLEQCCPGLHVRLPPHDT